MQTFSIDSLARDHLQRARNSNAGRSAETLFGGRDNMLRQTLIALTADTTLADHENPGEATAQVISGRVRLGTGDESWEAGPGDLVEIPASRHHLHATEDSVVLLTVAKHGHDG